MANVGTAAAGKTLIGAGVTSSPTFANIGTNSGLTNHGLLVAQNLGAFNAMAAGSAGQIVQSAGAAADPVYSTATYPSTTTINRLLYSSAANTITDLATANNGTLITSATGVPSFLANGTTGQVLTATTGSPPSWAAAASSGFTTINRQVFTSSGTYTPTANMKQCDIIAIGGGGAGGGAAATGSSQVCVGSGGGAGEYAQGLFSAATIGASKTVTIGAGGTGVSGTTGNAGGTTSVGSTLISAVGGDPGLTGAVATTSNAVGRAGGTGGTGGDFRTRGQWGLNGYANFLTAVALLAGAGGNSQYGSGGGVSPSAVSNQGGSANGYGGGGAGSSNYQNQSALAGGAGFDGIVIITEYI